MTIDVNGIPAIGLGTFGLTGRQGLAALGSAIDNGYRHIDTAQSYGTEENVGAAIARSGIDRSEFFVTTKITGGNLTRIGDSIEDSLALMGLDYLDLVLIHWPAQNDTPPVSAYIGDLAAVQDSGKSRLIGVSNFTRRLVDEATSELGPDRLVTNQVERHLFLQNHVLAAHCAGQGIALTAYLPMVGGRLGGTPDLQQIAEKHKATPTQIALAFVLALGSIAIPKSAQSERQKSNLAARDIQLDDDDMRVLSSLDRGERHIDPAGLAPDWD